MADTAFDHASRKAARLDPVGFFCWLLTDFGTWLRFARWLDTRTTPKPGERESTGDTVAELLSLLRVEAAFLFLLEFQTDPDPLMFGRLLRQLGQLWEDHRPDALRGSRYQLAAAVVNLTGTRASLPASHVSQLPGPDRLYCGLVVRERYMQEEDARGTLEAIAAGLVSRIMLVFVPLMLGAGDPEVIRRWLQIAEAEPDSQRRKEYGSLAKVMAELKDWYPAWEQALRGWEMRESRVVKEWKQEGAVEALRGTLDRLLRKRFGVVPNAVSARIEAVTDPEVLNSAIEQVQDLTRIEDLRI
jgi:hypothetical protein